MVGGPLVARLFERLDGASLVAFRIAFGLVAAGHAYWLVSAGHVRTFDGQVVFVPHALLAASRIVNYHTLPTRRIELKVKATLDSDLDHCRELLLEVMKDDSRVLEEPSPSVLATDADASGIEMVGWCWVENADWFPTRSDLWFRAVDAFRKDERVALSVARHEVRLSGRINEAP